MTYFGFLLRFLVIPILFLLFVNWREKDKPTSGFNDAKIWRGILIHIVLAVIYTTPWDNYLVATGVWYYDPDLVTGIVFGYVPLEEYTFFVLETLMIGLWWWTLARRKASIPDHPLTPNKSLRAWSLGLLAVLWVVSLSVLLSDWEPGTYLTITLTWALPAIAPQLAFGADILWHFRRLLGTVILTGAGYLSAMDALAIDAGMWTIDPSQSTGIFIGVLPIEEAVFFVITVVLVSFGMTLLLADVSQERLGELKSLLERLRGRGSTSVRDNGA
ncbi:MAG: lycopene cyclase domain-containing protein [Anaerolineales bacterium]|nr:lycopene cyclase domain-containing protein [Anaerolineales bacterium]